MILPLIVLIATAAAVSAGLYLTVRGFKASAARAAAGNGHSHDHSGAAPAPSVSKHDQATIDLLKRFFDGKACGICKRPIPQVQRTGPKPGLLDPATHHAYSWDHIPHDNLTSVLDTHVPLCSTCAVAEAFREHHPELIVDRDRSNPSAPSPNRLATGS
jgi:hypothetical protein